MAKPGKLSFPTYADYLEAEKAARELRARRMRASIGALVARLGGVLTLLRRRTPRAAAR